VTLSSSLPAEILVPQRVIIAAGATRAEFNITNLDNGLLEGPQVATIRATAPGFAPASDVIANYDRPTVLLSVSGPPILFETSGWLAKGQVRSSAPVAANVAVRLSSSDGSKLQVPEFAIIPVGQSSASFGYTVLDNNLIDGDELVTIRAMVPGWTEGQVQIPVLDNESASLLLSIPNPLSEDRGVLTNVGKVQIFGIVPTNITIGLTSDAPARLQVPLSVIIQAGQTSAVFNIVIPDNSVADGDQAVLVTASASGFQSAARTVTFGIRDCPGRKSNEHSFGG
jgi:hypothetical protein